MPDLGPYTWHVTVAYGVAIVLLNLVAWVSIRRGLRTRRQLEDLEARIRDRHTH